MQKYRVSIVAGLIITIALISIIAARIILYNNQKENTSSSLIKRVPVTTMMNTHLISFLLTNSIE